MTGSELLKRWLAENEVSLRTFAATVGTVAANVQNWRDGSTPGTKFALRIERATDGRVPFRAWLDDEERPRQSSQKRSPNRLHAQRVRRSARS